MQLYYMFMTLRKGHSLILEVELQLR